MTRESRVIVYSEGAFHDQPAPGWYREAEELEAGGLDWQKALSRVLGTDHDQYAESLGDVGIEIRVWRSTGLGTYVETGDCIRTWDAVGCPSRATGGLSRRATFCRSLRAPAISPSPRGSTGSAMR